MHDAMSSILQIKKVVYVNDSFVDGSIVPEINANFLSPVIVETNLFDWQLLMRASVQHKCLECVSRNKPRLTSLAKIAAGRRFKNFGHENGVEFLVLSGVFSDSSGDYSAGYYVRNPAKTYYDFYTRSGCTVLLKLGQLQPLDRKRVVINTRNVKARWFSAGEPEVSCLGLHQFEEEKVSLYRIRAECWITFKNQKQGVEVFVYEGSISVEGNRYETGTWLRYPAGSKVKIITKKGACLYVKNNIFL